ncbi:unnamed protein product [Moneuplotes crassus]|uniref:Uncharacterized protein n=1 Tax=Euplotes crassus TaxID=5936 RepID=A0AAD2DBK8_EUPCR|nr:unnamed protein product [Moneuplotes crassus]
MEGIKGELQTFDDEHDRLSDHKSQSDQEEIKEEAKEEVKKIEEAPKPPSPPKKKPLGKPRLAPRKITKTRASSYQMPSMRNKPTAKRSKIVKVLPGQEKPSKIQIFNKKPVMTKKKKKELEEKKRKDLELIRKRKQEEEEEKKAMMKVSTSLPEISHPEERVGGMLKGFNLKRTRTPANNNERVLIFSKRSDSEDPASDDENHYAFDKNDVEQYRRMGGYDNIRVREKKKEQELKRMLKSNLSHKKRRILTKIKAGMGFLKSSSRVNPIPDYNQPEKKVRIKDL